MNAINPSGWKPSLGGVGQRASDATFTGNRALMLEEPLIFEIGSPDRTGVDFEFSPLPLAGGGVQSHAPLNAGGPVELAAPLLDSPSPNPSRKREGDYRFIRNNSRSEGPKPLVQMIQP